MILKSKELERIKGYLIRPKTRFLINAGNENQREEEFNLEIQIGSKTPILSYIVYSDISCGIHQIRGLKHNDLFSTILTLVKPKYKKLFFIDLYREVFKIIKRKEKINTLIASNNNKSDFKFISSVLDDISSIKTNWKINPNSGNKIKMWVL